MQMQSLIEYVLEGDSPMDRGTPSELQWLGEATDAQFEEFLQALLDTDLNSSHDPAALLTYFAM